MDLAHREDVSMHRDVSTDLIDRLLAVARDRLGMEYSWVSSFVDGQQCFDQVCGEVNAFPIQPGDASPLEASYCQRVLDGRLPNLITDTANNSTTAELAVTHELGIGSYVGAPLRSESGAIGMLCCVSKGPAPHLRPQDVHSLELIAEVVSEILCTENPQRRLDREITDRITANLNEKRFRSVYQPIVCIRTGNVVAVEALTRFQEIPAAPNKWFTQAASVGLGVELEIAAITKALEGLPGLHPSQDMTVNASPATICDPRLIGLLAFTSPKRLIVEVTEHALVSDYDAVGRALAALRNLGVRIAVDDVGAGFASLAHVVELAPSILKIDKSIVRGMDHDPARQALGQAIMSVARRLKATVIAEGVETRAELDAVAQLGADQAQGFFLGRPHPLPVAQSVVSAISMPTMPVSGTVAPTASEDLAVRRFELAMLQSPIGTALVSLDGTFIHTNPSFAKMIGCTERDLDGKVFGDFSPDDREAPMPFWKELLQGQQDVCRVERRYIRPDGSDMWGETTVVLVRSATGQPMYFIAQLQEITDRRDRENLLFRQANNDHLTGVANRSAASSYLESLAADANRFGVLYCDLRKFKAVNDTLGHRAGDQVLVEVAHRLELILRPGQMVSRWGGDEFLVIIPNASPEAMSRLSQEIAGRVAQPVYLSPAPGLVNPCLTVGTAMFDPDADDTIDDALHRADSHMYRQRIQALDVPKPALEPALRGDSMGVL